MWDSDAPAVAVNLSLFLDPLSGSARWGSQKDLHFGHFGGRQRPRSRFDVAEYMVQCGSARDNRANLGLGQEPRLGEFVQTTAACGRPGGQALEQRKIRRGHVLLHARIGFSPRARGWGLPMPVLA